LRVDGVARAPFNGVARRASSAQCTSTKEESMVRRIVRSGLLAALVAAPLTVAVVAGPAGADAAAKVNINTASVKELQHLEGIGRGVAQRIVEYREKNGPFKRSEDLRKVDGVGPATFERNRERIVVK
jgi:competence ComEA-like helix-hairpin-helix protein